MPHHRRHGRPNAPRYAPRAAVVALLSCLIFAHGVRAEGTGPSLANLSLTGDWYVIVHYRDANAGDAEALHFKDFAWSIEQTEGALVWRVYPYVVFSEEQEELRKAFMRAAERWQPDAPTLARLRQELPVSDRAATSERMAGSQSEGFHSSELAPSGGPNIVTFRRDWSVRFAPDQIRIEVEDALGGAAGLSDLTETTSYVILERAAEGELAGEYREGALTGTFRMLRSGGHRLVR